jgi:uncharacterized protein (DUF58 family)
MTSPLLDPAFLARLDRLHLAARRIFSGRQQAAHVSRRPGAGSEFVEHRAYAAGDELRLLDWNALARTGRLTTKVFRQEADRDLVFALDVSASMGVEPAKFECARRLAAALAYIGLCELDRVHLVAFAEGVRAARAPLRGRPAAREMLRFWAELRAGGRTDLARLPARFPARRGGLVFLISDFLDPAGLPAGLDGLGRLGHEVVGLHVVTPRELAPGLLGEWRLVDPEGAGASRRVHLTRGSLRRYGEALRAHGQAVRRRLQARRGAYVRVRSDAPLEALILRELRAGRLLG